MRPVPRGARNTRPPRKAARKGMAGTLTLPVGDRPRPWITGWVLCGRDLLYSCRSGCGRIAVVERSPADAAPS